MLRGARNQKMNMVEIAVEFFEGEIVRYFTHHTI